MDIDRQSMFSSRSGLIDSIPLMVGNHHHLGILQFLHLHLCIQLLPWFHTLKLPESFDRGGGNWTREFSTPKSFNNPPARSLLIANNDGPSDDATQIAMIIVNYKIMSHLEIYCSAIHPDVLPYNVWRVSTFEWRSCDIFHSWTFVCTCRSLRIRVPRG